MRHVSEEWDQSTLAKCRRQLISASLLDFDALRKMSVTGRCQMCRVTRRPVSLSPPKRFFSLSQTKSWVFHELQICHAPRFHLQVHWVGGWVESLSRDSHARKVRAPSKGSSGGLGIELVKRTRKRQMLLDFKSLFTPVFEGKKFLFQFYIFYSPKSYTQNLFSSEFFLYSRAVRIWVSCALRANIPHWHGDLCPCPVPEKCSELKIRCGPTFCLQHTLAFHLWHGPWWGS